MNNEILSIHNKNKLIFQEKLLRPDGLTKACDIYDSLTQKNKEQVDCLGENFNRLIQSIYEEFLENYHPTANTSLDYYFNNYILWLYLVVERVDFIFDLLTYRDVNPDVDLKGNIFLEYYQDEFKVFNIIKKWANFIKHPKQFLFCHYPSYVFDKPTEENITIIDSKYIVKYFSGSKESPIDLTNKKDVYVIIPNLTDLTEQFCETFLKFIALITENSIVANRLRKKTVIEDYYRQQIQEDKSAEERLTQSKTTQQSKEENQLIIKSIQDTNEEVSKVIQRLDDIINIPSFKGLAAIASINNEMSASIKAAMTAISPSPELFKSIEAATKLQLGISETIKQFGDIARIPALTGLTIINTDMLNIAKLAEQMTLPSQELLKSVEKLQIKIPKSPLS